jgi:hypothetical protein
VTEQLEERLGARMAAWAEDIVDGPGFSSDDIVLAARTVTGQRWAAGLVVVVTAAAALLLVTAVLAVNRRSAPAPPANSPTSSPSPASSLSPSTPGAAAAPAGVPVASLGLDVLADGVIARPDGSRVPLRLGPGRSAVDATGVPAGWVVAAGSDTGSDVWFVPTSGAAQRIGADFGGYAVSADGRILVVAGSTGPSAVTAYELPSLRQLATTTAAVGMDPVVIGVNGNRVLLKGASGDGSPTEAAVWNLRTGRLRQAAGFRWLLDVSAAGAVLGLVAQARGPKDIVGGCLDVVALTDTLPGAGTGVCRPDLAVSYLAGAISPDGSWVALTTATGDHDERTVLLRSTDLHNGRWRPAPINGPPGARARFWVSGTTFVAAEYGGQTTRYYRCGVTQPCVGLAFPADLHEPMLVPKRGA